MPWKYSLRPIIFTNDRNNKKKYFKYNKKSLEWYLITYDCQKLKICKWWTIRVWHLRTNIRNEKWNSRTKAQSKKCLTGHCSYWNKPRKRCYKTFVRLNNLESGR